MSSPIHGTIYLNLAKDLLHEEVLVSFRLEQEFIFLAAMMLKVPMQASNHFISPAS